MDKKLAIIHTTHVTIEPLKNLASEFIPEVKVINFLDDSILPQLIENGGDIAEVRDRCGLPMLKLRKVWEQMSY